MVYYLRNRRKYLKREFKEGVKSKFNLNKLELIINPFDKSYIIEIHFEINGMMFASKEMMPYSKFYYYEFNMQELVDIIDNKIEKFLNENKI
jgi:hypothetical protein